jgi:pimeloyl-ACP methyl ester carboxylesterase
MRYFNGFCLCGEEILFDEYIPKSDFCVAGFSMGAIDAFEWVYNTKTRVDRLILISPAFFQTQKSSYKRVQLHHFKNLPTLYINTFLKNVAYPSDFELKNFYKEGTLSQLDGLLSYVWDKEKIQEVISRGVTIEVFIGKVDKIIDAISANEFFSSLTTTYLFNHKGHLLH